MCKRREEINTKKYWNFQIPILQSESCAAFVSHLSPPTGSRGFRRLEAEDQANARLQLLSLEKTVRGPGRANFNC